MFKVIHTAFQMKKGMEDPESFAQDLSSGLIGGFFASSLIILIITTVVSFFLGYFFDIGFFKFLGYLFALLFLLTLALSYFVKKMTKKMVSHTYSKISSEHKIVDIEIED